MNTPEDVSGQSIYRKWWFWVIEVPFIVIFVGALLRIPALNEKERTQEVVAQIHAQRLTLADVNGEHLPPQPDPGQVDATVEGIDANQNGIRDDVELVIFNKYPNSPKIRAAELQYAKALQMELMAFNSETLVAAIQEEGRGNICILDTKRTQDVEELVFNTDARKNNREDLYRKFMTSYALPNSDFCDIDPKTFAN